MQTFLVLKVLALHLTPSTFSKNSAKNVYYANNSNVKSASFRSSMINSLALLILLKMLNMVTYAQTVFLPGTSCVQFFAAIMPLFFKAA